MAGVEEFEERLTRFYKHYAPEKVPTVATAAVTYRGREEQMWRALEKKYGRESAVAGSEQYTHDSPAAAAAATATTPKVPTLNFNPFKPRLIRFYEAYARDKLSGVDATLAKYKGKEEPMFAALVKKYGAEPEVGQDDGETPAASAAAAASSPAAAMSPRGDNTPGAKSSSSPIFPPEGAAAASSFPVEAEDDIPFKSRMIRFYQKYVPEKVNTVDSALIKYKGKEELMFAALVKKYGAEPEAPAASSPRRSVTPAENTPVSPVVTKSPSRTTTPRTPKAKTPRSTNSQAGAAGEPAGEGGQEEEGTAAELSPFKPRLVRLLEKYTPEKVASADSLLAKYKGKEPQMFVALVKKLGPEPEESVPETEEAARKEEEVETIAPRQPPAESEEEEVKTRENPSSPAAESTEEKQKADEDAPAEAAQQKAPRVQIQDAASREKTPKPESDESESEDEPPTEEDATAAPFNIRTWMIREQGIAPYAIPKLLTLYGTGQRKEQYAGSMLMLLRTIGDDQLFDLGYPSQAEESRLVFPAEEDYPKGKREAVDDLAFSHLQAHRTLFLQGFEAGCVVREEEAEDRSLLREAFVQLRSQISYQQLVLDEAINLIEPIETETRMTLLNDERLRFQGVCTWFRTKRHELQLEQDDPLDQVHDAERKMERFRQTQAKAEMDNQRRYVYENKKSLSASTEKWKRMSSPSGGGGGAGGSRGVAFDPLLHSRDISVVGAGGRASSPMHTQQQQHVSNRSSRALSPSVTKRDSFDPITRAQHPRTFAHNTNTQRSLSRLSVADAAPPSSILRSQSTRSTSVGTSKVDYSPNNNQNLSPTPSGASTKYSTLSDRRGATLSALKDKPFKSQRAKKVASQGCFSQLKLVAAGAARESVSTNSTDRERFTFS